MQQQDTNAGNRQAATPVGAATFFNCEGGCGFFRKKVDGSARPTSAGIRVSITKTAIVAALIMICGLPARLIAQTSVPATGIEQNIGTLSAVPTNDMVVNNAMLDYWNVDPVSGHNVNGVLKAIVYGIRYWPNGTSITQSYLYVEDNLGNNMTVQLPDSACYPDVALSEVYNTRTHTLTYRAVVVYDIMGFHWDPAALALTPPSYVPAYPVRKPWVAIYDLNNVGAGGLSATFASGFPKLLSPIATGTCASSPHIDMWTDAAITNPYSGLPTMHKFGICWVEDTTAAKLTVEYGDAAGATFLSGPLSMPTTNCTNPDIAVLTDQTVPGSPIERMYVTYSDVNSYTRIPANTLQKFRLWVSEFSINPFGTVSNTSNQLLEDSIASLFPRIDAMSQYDAGTSPQTVSWEVAADVKFVRLGGVPVAQPTPGPAPWHVAGYNNFTVPVPASYSLTFPMGTSQTPLSYNLFVTDDVKSACVAAGVSPSLSSDIGNQQFTAGYFPWQITPGIRYARDIDATTGALITPSVHYEVNNSSSPVSYNWDEDKSLAFSNCNNSGRDIFSSWYNGTNIVYKHSNPNVMAFRLGHATAVSNTASGISVYPNPANTELHIRSVNSGSYQISDVTGKRILSGTLDVNTTVDVHSLAPGLYLLQASQDGKSAESFKFTKE